MAFVAFHVSLTLCRPGIFFVAINLVSDRVPEVYQKKSTSYENQNRVFSIYQNIFLR